MATPPDGVRLDNELMAELLRGRPDFRETFSLLWNMASFFATEARAAFVIEAPARLREKGAHQALTSQARLRLFRRSLVLRTAALLPEAVSSLNESRLLPFALAARAVLETAAAAAYHGSRLALELGAQTLPEDYDDRLRHAFGGSRFNWIALRDLATHEAQIQEYGTSRDLRSQYPPNRATNVLTMFEDLARRIGDGDEGARGRVFFDYSLLSDLCHPSLGSNLLFLDGEHRPDVLRLELQPPQDAVLAMSEAILPCVVYSAGAVLQVVVELEVLDERLSQIADCSASSGAANAGI